MPAIRIMAECIDKVRDNNNQIILYVLKDTKGKKMSIKPDFLKQMIFKNKIDVINLTLTSDFRLVDKNQKPKKANTANTEIKQETVKITENTEDNKTNTSKNNTSKNNNIENKKSSDEKIAVIINRAKVLGLSVTECCIKNDGIITVIARDKDYTILIPSNVESLRAKKSDHHIYLSFSDMVGNISGGTVKVIGGSELKIVDYMFYGCKLKTLDLSGMDVSKATSMRKMFGESDIEHLNLGDFNASKVQNFSYMFFNAKINKITFTNFKTDLAYKMNGMFQGIKTGALNLSSFNTENVASMNDMFNNSSISELDVSSFDVSNVKNFDYMFSNCNVQKLDLSSFRLSNADHTWKMFYCCTSEVISTDEKIAKELCNRDDDLVETI